MEEVKMVKVEVLDPGMKARSPFRTMDELSALEGEAKGIWRIIKKDMTAEAPEILENKMMTPDPLAREDLFGPRGNIYETKGIKKKKIGWIMDYSKNGGAEISSFTLLEIGRLCGYEIELITQKTSVRDLDAKFRSVDLLIIGNVWQFSQDGMRRLQNAIFADRIPYVKYEHDTRELGRAVFAKRLFGNSKLNIFISPLHYEHHKARFSCDGIALPIAIDVGMYHPVDGIKRVENSALVSNVRGMGWKILQKFVNERQDLKFTILGKLQIVSGRNVKMISPVHYKEMPKLYSSFEYLVHMLDSWKAGERIIFEAALCGCKVIANSNVGHTSWHKDLNDVENLRVWLSESNYEFWKRIDEIVL